jgi:pimeloyl-ACP methyl ester carboxylesterase
MFAKLPLVCILVLIILVLTMKRFLYFQPSFQFLQPITTFEDVYQGRLHGWYKQGRNHHVILYCHSFQGNLSSRQDRLKDCLLNGFSVLIFDYSGYGWSQGVPSEQTFFENADIFYRFLLDDKHYKPQEIVPYGEEMGASIAMYLARKYQLPKVILCNPYPSIKVYIQRTYPSFRMLSCVCYEFNLVKYMNQYAGQSLVLVEDDFEQFETIINKATHVFTFKTNFELCHRIVEFVK